MKKIWHFLTHNRKENISPRNKRKDPEVREMEFLPFSFSYACNKGIIDGRCEKTESDKIYVHGSYMTNGDSVPMAIGTEYYSFYLDGYISLHSLASEIASEVVFRVGYGVASDLKLGVLRSISDAQQSFLRKKGN